MWAIVIMHFIPGDPLCIIHFNCLTNDPPLSSFHPLVHWGCSFFLKHVFFFYSISAHIYFLHWEFACACAFKCFFFVLVLTSCVFHITYNIVLSYALCVVHIIYNIVYHIHYVYFILLIILIYIFHFKIIFISRTFPSVKALAVDPPVFSSINWYQLGSI